MSGVGGAVAVGEGGWVVVHPVRMIPVKSSVASRYRTLEPPCSFGCVALAEATKRPTYAARGHEDVPLHHQKYAGSRTKGVRGVGVTSAGGVYHRRKMHGGGTMLWGTSALVSPKCGTRTTAPRLFRFCRGAVLSSGGNVRGCRWVADSYDWETHREGGMDG